MVAAVFEGFGLMTTGVGSAQTLGDVARQQKQKSAQQQQSPAARKVITEDDIPKQDTISSGGHDASDTANPADASKKEENKGESAQDKLQSAQDYKAAIHAQQHTVDAMQKERRAESQAGRNAGTGSQSRLRQRPVRITSSGIPKIAPGTRPAG